MDLELGHTNYRNSLSPRFLEHRTRSDLILLSFLSEIGPLGKAGVKSSPLTPSPAGLGVSITDLAKFQELSDKENGDSADNVVSWHNDSYPYVCVLMLSDVSEMIGGETALQVSPFSFSFLSYFSFGRVFFLYLPLLLSQQCGDGRIVKARGPGVGNCVVMQGRHIRHAALRAYNTAEARIFFSFLFTSISFNL